MTPERHLRQGRPLSRAAPIKQPAYARQLRSVRELAPAVAVRRLLRHSASRPRVLEDSGLEQPVGLKLLREIRKSLGISSLLKAILIKCAALTTSCAVICGDITNPSNDAFHMRPCVFVTWQLSTCIISSSRGIDRRRGRLVQIERAQRGQPIVWRGRSGGHGPRGSSSRRELVSAEWPSKRKEEREVEEERQLHAALARERAQTHVKPAARASERAELQRRASRARVIDCS
ncbi:hypothetical protein MRX96_007579 [Rhipicephalus microplus]